MVETIRKGNWQADAATRKRVIQEYVNSVNRHGVGCAEHTCGNPRLQKYVLEAGKAAGIPVPALEGYQRAMERATGEAVSSGAERLDTFANQNDAEMTARVNTIPAPSRDARNLEGFLMEERQRQAQAQASNRRDASPTTSETLTVSLPILGVLLLWRWRRGRVH
jgi:cobaltochelatase CobN